jgi:hypothetical protein
MFPLLSPIDEQLRPTTLSFMSTSAGTPTAPTTQGSPSTITQKSDFLAAEEIKGILAGRDKAEQERIMRWVAESLSLSQTTMTPAHAVHGAENSPQSAIIPPAHTPRTGSASTSRNIKSFVDEKKPKNDLQFAAIVAYFHRFEAPDAARKETIGSEDLQDGGLLWLVELRIQKWRPSRSLGEGWWEALVMLQSSLPTVVFDTGFTDRQPGHLPKLVAGAGITLVRKLCDREILVKDKLQFMVREFGILNYWFSDMSPRCPRCVPHK